MKPLTDFASSVLAQTLHRQPLSPGKVAFAWQVAAGAKLAAVAQVSIEHDAREGLSLAVRPRDARWAVEIDRLKPLLIERLTALLGKRVTVVIT